MKIRDLLTLTFSLSTAVVIIGLGLFVYVFSASFQREEFYKQLEERVRITEKLFVEGDKMDSTIRADFKSKFLNTLPDEIEVVRQLTKSPPRAADSLKMKFPPEFVDKLFQNKEARHQEKGRQMTGKFYRFGGQEYVVAVSAVDKFGEMKLLNLRKILLIGLPVCLLIVVGIGWYHAKRALEPIAEKIQKANQITATNLHLRLDVVNEKDELGQLAITFNEMLDRLEAAFEVQKKFISNASHEIRNPLTAIMGETEVCLEKNRTPEEYRRALKNISEEAERLNQLVTSLLHLAKTDFAEGAIKKQPIRIDEVLIEAKKTLDAAFPNTQIHLDFSDFPAEEDSLTVFGNANLLRSAFINLLDNACKFSDNQPVVVKLAHQQGKIILHIEDKGIGIPTEDAEKITQPFFRSENARRFKGFGIGLALTARILQLHHARMKVESTLGQGSRFILTFPQITAG